ncbi:MAG: serine/threonine protein phosphatase [Cellulomonas sp. 73-145]|uniref:PP2C family protein-serine/threonine phosphatase n=1 Tax=Cellulomonas sp. 73-145 TaxID=1895739 RepID=UPI000926720B|nr:SpoIIE family protein phosphatase [Cellulomonas sp. 73-145]OJV59508.1 MAG: serine/threonine protein phosphatase [Cellulomonas sp. 73-145]
MRHTPPASDDVARFGPVGTRPDGPLRILLVEDDDGDALLVREHLSDAGLETRLTWVRTMDQALERLDVDCVLLDLGLPDTVGLAGLERLLSHQAPAVVVLTGLAGDGVGLAAVAAGAQDYLVKGDVDGESLGRSVRYAVQRRRLEDTDRALYRSLVRGAEAARLERALLPRPSVQDPGLEVRVGYRAGRDGLLGGDFYDVVQRPDGTVLAMVGDVCGHGPDEAALGATLRTAWRTLVVTGVPTEQILGQLELVLATERSRPELFTTVSMLAVHPDRRHADLYLAGHPVPMLVGDPARLLPASARGRALGIPVPGGWDPLPLELGDRWRVMLYTDGLLEATVGGAGERLGKDGLLRVVEGAAAAHGHVPAVPPGAGDDPLVTTVLDAVRDRHGGDLVDDAAVIVIGRTS